MLRKYRTAFAFALAGVSLLTGCQSGISGRTTGGAFSSAQGASGNRSMATYGQSGASQQSAVRSTSQAPQQIASSQSASGFQPNGVALASYGQTTTSHMDHPGMMPQIVQQASHRHLGSNSDSCPACNGASSRYVPIYADCEPCPSVPGGYAPMRWIDPQEYVFDGGDRDPKVQVLKDGTVAGLQPEDTVIHYDRKTGETLVEPSCRFPVYAPRFGAVRKITKLRESELSQSTLASNLPVAASATREALPPLRLRQPVRAIPEDSVRIVESLRDRNRGIAVDRIIPVLAVESDLPLYADFQIIRTGIQQDNEKARLEQAVAAARVWSGIESVQVIIDGKESAIIGDIKSAQETVLYDYKGKPCVRICKVGSHQIANPGDEIEFTIRFDNRGVEDVSNVVILDSLPPRLEYLEGTQRGTFEATFSSTPNSAGSSVLRWELQQPLKAGEGGFIIFRCLVR